MSAGVLGDPVALVGRVVDQVVNQLMPDDVRAGAGDTSADELLATALGNSLARMIAGDDGPPETDEPEAGDGGGPWLTDYHELLDRNSTLAAALGACDCWGSDRDCPVCAGAGTPGWALPDERLFAVYVRPAVDAAQPPRATGRPKTHSTNNGQPTTGA